jgi:hypothetical protein
MLVERAWNKLGCGILGGNEAKVIRAFSDESAIADSFVAD